MSVPYDAPVAIAARMARLEDENRRLKRLVVAAALLSFVSATLLVGTLIRPGLAQESRSGLGLGPSFSLEEWLVALDLQGLCPSLKSFEAWDDLKPQHLVTSTRTLH